MSDLTKNELRLLEKVFAAETSLDVFQTKSKLAKSLEERGYIVMCEKHLGQDRFGKIIVKGYKTTFLGNVTYCMSDLCLGERHDHPRT